MMTCEPRQASGMSRTTHPDGLQETGIAFDSFRTKAVSMCFLCSICVSQTTKSRLQSLNGVLVGPIVTVCARA